MNGKRPMKHGWVQVLVLSFLCSLDYLLSLSPISPIFNMGKNNTYLQEFALRLKVSNMRDSAYPISISKARSQLDLIQDSKYWMKALTYANDFNNSTQHLFLTATLTIFGLRHVKIFSILSKWNVQNCF